MQVDPAAVADQAGALDRLLGPMGGFVLALAGLAFLGRHHIAALKAFQERLEAKDAEIHRLSEARVEAAMGEARDLIARMEGLDDQEGRRWAKLGRMLALAEPLGMTLGRIELMLRAVAKKAGAATPHASAPGASQAGIPMMDDGDEDRSMF